TMSACRRRSSTNVWGYRMRRLLSQLNQCCTSATLIGRCSDKARNVGMSFQQITDSTSQGARPMSVHNSHLAQTCERGLIEKLINGVNCFISCLSNYIQFRATAFL